MNETRERTAVGALVIALFTVLILVAAAVFGSGILGSGAENDATATPSIEPTQGPSATPGSTETPNSSSTATIVPPSPTPLVGESPLALQVHAASELSVQAHSGEALGRIQGTVFSLIPGSVSYAVLVHLDGSTGLVPWQAFDAADPGNSLLLSSLDPQVFIGAPAYDLLQMPDLITDPAWDDEAHTFWSGHIALPESLALLGDSDQVIAASFDRLAGMPVMAAEGTAVGEVTDLILDFASASPVYMVVELSGGATDGSGTVLVPWERMGEVTLDPATLILAASVEALAQAPKVNMAEWPDWLDDPDWDIAIREYWSGLNSS